MGLLGSLGLPTIAIPQTTAAPTTAKAPPKKPAPPAAPVVQTTVSLFNGSAGELKLVKSSLEFGGTAKFEGGPPDTVPAQGKATFRVVEPMAGAKKTAGMAWYAYQGKGGKVDVIFGWSGRKAEVKVIGDGTFTRQAQAVEDLDRGNEYRMMFKEGGADAGEMLPPLADPDAPAEKPPAGEDPNAQPAAEDPNAQPAVDDPSAQPATDDPNAEPQPAAEANAPVKVTIVNESGAGMTFGSSKLEQEATFKSDPPKAVDGGRTGRFELQSGTPDWPATAGSVTYTFTTEKADDPNGPGIAQTATFEWNGQEWSGRIEPGAEDFQVKSEGEIGNYLFTLGGPKLEFAPPEEAREPTLRKGDKSPDGWVEYLQSALNTHIGAGLEVDGDFGSLTLKAVKAFQRKYKKEGVLVDGIVGDQTWSYLREGAPAKPKTDGRKAHSFVEKGAEARWFKEKDWVIYDYGGDALLMLCVSVGDTALVENRKVRFRIVDPAGAQKVLDRPVGPAFKEDAEKRVHMVAIQQFSTLFDESHTGKAAGGDYQVTAYFPADLGGDTYTGPLHIME